MQILDEPIQVRLSYDSQSIHKYLLFFRLVILIKMILMKKRCTRHEPVDLPGVHDLPSLASLNSTGLHSHFASPLFLRQVCAHPPLVRSPFSFNRSHGCTESNDNQFFLEILQTHLIQGHPLDPDTIQ